MPGPSRCEILVPTRYNHKIAYVGDFPTVKDANYGFPFESAYGELLFSMALQAKLVPRESVLTNVFQDPMPGGRINAICTKKKEATSRAKELGWTSYHLPAVGQALYVDPYRSLETLRLRDELLETSPNLVVALGATALWALCGTAKIGKYRGTILESTLVPGLKVLPTYHPRTVQAEYSKKEVVVADLLKAKAEAEFPEIHKVVRTIYIAETLQDIYQYWEKYLKKAPMIGIDIETIHHEFISMIGFADCPERALVVPFMFSITGKKGSFRSYWETVEDEVSVWEFVRSMVELSRGIVGQNFLYDTQYLLQHSILPYHFDTDTMIMQHATYIELPKSLAFLGSLHTNESAWKTERKRGQKISELKADE